MNKFISALVSSATVAALSLSLAPAASAQSSDLFGLSSSSSKAAPSKPSQPSAPKADRTAIVELVTERFTDYFAAGNVTQTKELNDAAQSALKDVDSESVFWFNDEGFYKSYPSDADIEIGFYRIPIDQLVTEFENSGMTIDEVKEQLENDMSDEGWDNEFWDDQDIREIGLATVEKNGYLYFAVAAHWPEEKSKERYAYQMALLIALWEGADN